MESLCPPKVIDRLLTGASSMGSRALWIPGVLSEPQPTIGQTQLQTRQMTSANPHPVHGYPWISMDINGYL